MITVVQDLVPTSKWHIKCTHPMSAKFIVVHNTANDASAYNEISYMKTNNLYLSYHFAIDDKEVRQGLRLDRNGWHAGDGSEGNGNRNGIGIEICYSKSGGDKFIKAEKLAAEFIAQLLKERGWGIDKVKKHQDFSGKYCPHRTLDMGWNRFLNMIETHLREEKETEILYRVQVGAYKNKDNALAMEAKLKEDGFGTYLVEVGGLYKVQVGAYRIEDNAEAMADKLEKKGYKTYIVEDGVVEEKEEPVKKTEVEKEPASAAKYNVGDKVSFNYLYTTASGTGKVKSAITSGTITQIKAGMAAPYLINGGAGWLSDALITKKNSNVVTTIVNTVKPIKVGDRVKIKKGAKDYNGRSIASWVYNNTYRVDQLNGKRAVLDEKGLCTAFNTKDLTRV